MVRWRELGLRAALDLEPEEDGKWAGKGCECCLQRVEFLVTWILRALWMSQGGKCFSGWGALGVQLSTAAWPPGGLGQGGSDT